MLKAKLDSVRKNKKGFSLIELIIVVAIMVALIAVLAPSYVKYVQKSRDAAINTAAEDFATAAKTILADPDMAEDYPDVETPSEDVVILVQVSDGKLNFSLGSGAYAELDELVEAAGADKTKSMGKSDKVYEVAITSGGVVTGPNLQDS